MKIGILWMVIWGLGVANTALAQDYDALNLIKRAQARNSSVAAARANVQAKQAALRGAGAPADPQLELAPGLGFTNSNAFLSQELDLFGRRKAAARVAAAALAQAELGVRQAESDVASVVLDAIARQIAAADQVTNARANLDAANALQAAVEKQNEIGEAPKVHVSRAALETIRAQQAMIKADAELEAAQATLSSWLGESVLATGLTWGPFAKLDIAQKAGSWELLEAQQSLVLAQAVVAETRGEGAPHVAAGFTTDAWSLDRNAFRRDNFGLQLTVRMPLLDRGSRRSAVQSRESEVRAAEARVQESKRLAELAYRRAQGALRAARQVAASFAGDAMPKAEAMLTSMREGYAQGLVTLIEVLEAQRTVTLLRQERAAALLAERLAEIELARTTLSLPGAEVSQ